MRRIFAAVAVMLAACAAFSQEVMDLDAAISTVAAKVVASVPSAARVGIKGFSSDTQEMSRYVATRFESALRRGGLKVVERDEANLRQIDAELDYQYEGNVNDSDVVMLGRQMSVQYLVFGSFEQYGSYLSLNVHATNVETLEAVVVETVGVRTSATTNQLLGDSRKLESLDSFLSEILRCKERSSALQRERDKELERMAAAIRLKYQEQINAVRKQPQFPWENEDEYSARLTEQIRPIESRRDTEIAGERRRISIGYDEQQSRLAASERDLRQRVEMQTFTLSGAQVEVSVGKFNTKASPKNWPVSVKSADKRVKYQAQFLQNVTDADVGKEWTKVDSAVKNGTLSGEISYKIVFKNDGLKYDVYVVEFKVFTSPGQAWIQQSVNAVTNTQPLAAGISRSEIAQAQPRTQPRQQDKKKAQPDAPSQSVSAPAEPSAPAAYAGQSTEGYADGYSYDDEGDDGDGGRPDDGKSDGNGRITNNGGAGYLFLYDGWYSLNGLWLQAFSWNPAKYFSVDWINAEFAFGDAFYMGATVDAVLSRRLARHLQLFARAGLGFYYMSYGEDIADRNRWTGNNESEAGMQAKLGFGLDVPLGSQLKLTAGYDMHLMFGREAIAADGIHIGLAFGREKE